MLGQDKKLQPWTTGAVASVVSPKLDTVPINSKNFSQK